MKNIDQVRDAAVKVVFRVLREGAYSDAALKQELDESGFTRLDKAFATEIVSGTLRNLTLIDWIKSQFVKRDKIEPRIEDIIRCGIYQLLFMDRVPDSAVCNESAELAREYGHEGTVKFVNGVLRNISRNKEKLKYPDKDKDIVKYLSVFYSHPKWMVKKFMKDYGREFTESLIKANNEIPPFTIRCNNLKINKTELISILSGENIEYAEGSYNPEAIHIRRTSSIEGKSSFKKGYYQVQDESSMLVAHITDPKPGETILDMCSAPGGKTAHMAELMGNKGLILARDIYEYKLKLVEENCIRLGIGIVRTELHNAMDMDPDSFERFDKVLLDAPCSGLGVMRRKTDLRWQKEPEDLKKLVSLQKGMLKTASNYVKPGGKLLYSTCTINKEENIDAVRDFLRNNDQFRLESLADRIPENLLCESAYEGYLELYPNIHKTDGFFIANMRKRNT